MEHGGGEEGVGGREYEEKEEEWSGYVFSSDDRFNILFMIWICFGYVGIMGC